MATAGHGRLDRTVNFKAAAIWQRQKVWQDDADTLMLHTTQSTLTCLPLHHMFASACRLVATLISSASHLACARCYATYRAVRQAMLRNMPNSTFLHK